MPTKTVATLRLPGADEALERWLLIQDACTRLLNFQNSMGHMERRSELGPRLSESMWRSEQDVRVVLSVALDTINDLRDQGVLDELVETQVLPAGGSELNWREALQRAGDALKCVCPAYDDRVLTAASAMLAKSHTHITVTDGYATVEHSGHPRPVVVSLEGFRRRPGGLGRVDSKMFFGTAAAAGAFSAKYLLVPESSRTPEDGYARIVTALASARDLMAAQVNITRYFGRPHFRSGDGIGVTIAVILAIAALLVGGVALMWKHCPKDSKDHNEGLCTLGFILGALGLILLGGNLGATAGFGSGGLTMVVPI